MRSASARGVAAAALAALATAVPAGGAVLGSAGRPAAAEPPGWVGGAFRTVTGESVTVFVSTTYAPEQVTPQRWAEFFAGMPHGNELGNGRDPHRHARRGRCALRRRGPRLLQRARARHAGRVVRRGGARAGRAARVRPPHRRQPVEPALAGRRLGTEAVGDSRPHLPAVGAAARRSPATTARITGSTRGRRSPSRTVSSRSGRPARRWPPGGSSTGASIPARPPCGRSSRTSRRRGRARSRHGRVGDSGPAARAAGSSRSPRRSTASSLPS